MAGRYNSETLRKHINGKLAAYSREAASYRRWGLSPSVVRTLKRGSLAAVIPLAAATGDANAQCTSGPPFGVVTLTSSSNTVFIPLGVPGESVRLRFAAAFPDLTMLGIGVNIVGSSYSIAPGVKHFFPLAFAVASSVFVPPTEAKTSGYGCYDGTNGCFCGGDSGFMVLRSTSDARLGWLHLTVTTLDFSQAVVSVGQRGMQASPSPTIHLGNCASLPVELVSFDAIIGVDGVALSWETASELNNAGFELQRASGSETFRKIAFIEGHGTSIDPHAYTFTDDTVEPNAHYRYRLKQLDFDGTTSFSEIVEVFTEDPSQIALSEFYPNPSSNGRATLNINVADPVDATVEVYDVRGALVDSQSRMLNAGQNQLRFRTDDLADGPHFAKVQIGERVMYRQFVVVR